MYRPIIAALFAVSLAFATINPSSEQDTPVPSFEATNSVNALVTQEFGVSVFSTDLGAVLLGFSVGSGDFEYNDGQNLTLPGCSAQLLNVQDTADTFLVFCGSGNDSFTMVEVEVSDTAFSVKQQQSFDLDEGQTVQISASAFVTAQGNVYMALSDSEEISILEFSVASFSATVKIPNIAPSTAGNGTNATYEVVDLHSLPFDSGVAVIMADDSDNQYFVFFYFNGTVVNINIPSGQQLVFVGRHRGSSFGYTIGEDNSGAYTVVTAWDLSDATMTNSIQLKGTVDRTSGHFSTEEQVFCYTSSGSDGYLNELPYSEYGFLPKSANSATIDPASSGNLADGQDGTYIYAYTSDSNDNMQLSRWTY